jgi:TRAP-type C4-dicarboxylate transport system permease small subunit
MLAVIGRRAGVPFLGSVEVAQVCVLLAGGTAIVAATLGRDHASVRVFTEKASPGARDIFRRIACLMAAAFLAVLTTGSAWILWDLRDGAEQTELLSIPVVVLRVFWLACAAACTAVLAAQAFRRSRLS